MRITLALAASSFVGVAAACGPTTPDVQDAGPPPKICQTPAALSPIHYTDVTSDFGLDAILANTIISADFDGDGRPDIVTTTGWSQAGNYVNVSSSTDPHNGMRVRHLLINQGGTAFVDKTDESGILTSPSGTGELGFGLMNAGDLDDDGDVDFDHVPRRHDERSRRDHRRMHGAPQRRQGALHARAGERSRQEDFLGARAARSSISIAMAFWISGPGRSRTGRITRHADSAEHAADALPRKRRRHVQRTYPPPSGFRTFDGSLAHRHVSFATSSASPRATSTTTATTT